MTDVARRRPAGRRDGRPPTGAGRVRGGRSASRAAQYLFVVPAALYVLIFFGYPIAYNVVMSLEHYTVSSFFTGEAPFVGLGNYRAVVHNPLMGKTLVNTALFTVGSLVFQFGIGLALAMFFRRRFPLNGVLRSLLLLPWLLPLVVSGTIFRWLLDQDYGALNQILLSAHLIDHTVPWLASTSLALVSVTMTNIWVGIPFNMVILYGGLQAIPEQYYEAAQIDGAGRWARFRYVTWPMLRPVSAVVLMLGFLYTIKVFDIIMVLTSGGPANSSQTLTTWAYQLSFQHLAFGRGAAVGDILIVIALVFALIYLRSVRRSAADGGTA